MRKFYLLLAAGLLTVLIVTGFARLASAHSFHTGSNVTLDKSQTIDQSVFTAGRTIDIASTVSGDVFCAGQNVTVSGTVHGDVICAGQTITVNGTIDGDVRLAGQDVNLGAKVSGNATIAAQSFDLQLSGSVGHDATIGSGDATINGLVGRDLAVSSTTVIISSAIGRNIQANAESLKLSSNARIRGNVHLVSKNNLVREPGAVVAGTVTHVQPSTTQNHHHGPPWAFWFLYWLAALLLVAAVLALLFPRLLATVTDHAWPFPWMALLTGFIAVFVAPAVIALAAVTVIGIPLALILALIWLVLLIFSGPFFAYFIGRQALRRPRNVLLTMLVGSLIVILLLIIPFLNVFVFLALLWIGTGMELLAIFHRTPRPSYAAVPVASPSPVPPEAKETSRRSSLTSGRKKRS